MSGRYYSKAQLIFIAVLSVVMVIIVGLGTLVSILSSRRRNRLLTDSDVSQTEYTLKPHVEDVWTTRERYSRISVV